MATARWWESSPRSMSPAVRRGAKQGSCSPPPGRSRWQKSEIRTGGFVNFSIKVDPTTWQQYISTAVRGKALLLDPFTNKGTAFTARERDELDLNGLLPAQVSTIEQQLDRVYENFQAKPAPLEKYIYMASLQDRNETLFFRLCHERIDEMMPVIYTPVVGEACQRYSHIYRRGRGLYINFEQRE